MFVPLGRGITARQTVEEDYVFLAGQPEPVKKDRVKLLVLIRGTLLENGLTFYSTHECALTDSLLLGHFQEIETMRDGKLRSWKGWENFEMNSEMFVFGYASLSSPSSVEATLGHPVDAGRFCYAKLQGWTRTWCVGSDKSSHPERTYILPSGLKYAGVTVVLGLESRPYGECDGVVFPVSRSDLSLLDVRERNYKRIDVSQHVTWAGKPDTCNVYTYIPLPEACARIAEAVKAGREVNVRRGYVRLVHEAFAELGPAGQPREWDSPPYKVEEMQVQVDPTLAPPKIKLGFSSYLQDPSRAGYGLESISQADKKRDSGEGDPA